MQKTKFDHWLHRKYVHVIRIYFNTMPESLPAGLELLEAGEEGGGRYRYRCSTRSEELAQDVCNLFLAENITYTSRIDSIDTPFARFVGNEQRSVTMLLVWIGIFFMAILFFFSGITQTALSIIMQDKDAVKAQDQAKKEQRLRGM